MMSRKALDATGGDGGDEGGGGGADGAAAAAAAAAGDGSCPVCGVTFCAGDVIGLLPAEAERERADAGDV